MAAIIKGAKKRGNPSFGNQHGNIYDIAGEASGIYGRYYIAVAAGFSSKNMRSFFLAVREAARLLGKIK